MLWRLHIEYTCTKAGLKMHSEKELQQVLAKHSDVIEEQDDRAIERLATDYIKQILTADH